jgi:hypothetical protein
MEPSSGTAASLFWTVNADMGFTLARGGTVVRRFDPLLYGLGPEGEPLPEERGLPFGVPGGRLPRAALTLAERLTGDRLDRDWVLATARPTWTTAARLP